MSTADDKAYIMYEAPRQELDLKDKTLSFTREPRGDLEKRKKGGEGGSKKAGMQLVQRDVGGQTKGEKQNNTVRRNRVAQ